MVSRKKKVEMMMSIAMEATVTLEESTFIKKYMNFRNMKID